MNIRYRGIYSQLEWGVPKISDNLKLISVNFNSAKLFYNLGYALTGMPTKQ
jgi:hypothetical protein